MEVLSRGLRAKTGFVGLTFDSEGLLILGDRSRIEGGSDVARDLISRAVDSGDSFVLENCSQSPEVGFAEIIGAEVYLNAAGERHDVWRVRLDLDDFSELRGVAQAVTAFDPAMHLLHELGHGVLRLRDPISDEDPLGECEVLMNRVRRQLGLPERQTYEPEYETVVMPGDKRTSVRAELSFQKHCEGACREGRSRSYLYFNSERVCGKEKSRLSRARKKVS